jgi:hypothetical protein
MEEILTAIRPGGKVDMSLIQGARTWNFFGLFGYSAFSGGTRTKTSKSFFGSFFQKRTKERLLF